MSNAPCVRLLLVAATVLLAACTTMIDGQEVGQRICADADQLVGDVPCREFAEEARSRLDYEQTGPVAVSDVVIYADPVRRLGLEATVYVLFRLDDGTDYLYRVQCGFYAPEGNVVCFTVAPGPGP